MNRNEEEIIDFTKINFDSFDYDPEKPLEAEQIRAFSSHTYDNPNPGTPKFKLITSEDKRIFEIPYGFYDVKERSEFDYLVSKGFVYCMAIGLFSENKTAIGHIPPGFSAKNYITKMCEHFSDEKYKFGFLYGVNSPKNNHLLSEAISTFHKGKELGFLNHYGVLKNEDSEGNPIKTDIWISNDAKIKLIQNNRHKRTIRLQDLI